MCSESHFPNIYKQYQFPAKFILPPLSQHQYAQKAEEEAWKQSSSQVISHSIHEIIFLARVSTEVYGKPPFAHSMAPFPNTEESTTTVAGKFRGYRGTPSSVADVVTAKWPRSAATATSTTAAAATDRLAADAKPTTTSNASEPASTQHRE